MLEKAIDAWLRVHGIQALACYGLAVLNHPGGDDEGKILLPPQFTEADLRIAEVLARSGTHPKLNVRRTKKEDR
ncbi:MAG: hypothetical protein L0387_16465 [Acidobacteria bacterium]|nr:hypothetical protein [Acidobacteriota bacterium]